MESTAFDVPYWSTFDLAEFLLLPENAPQNIDDRFWRIRNHIEWFEWDSLRDKEYRRNLLRDFIAAGLAPHLREIRYQYAHNPHPIFPSTLNPSYRLLAWNVIETARSILDHNAQGQCWTE